MLLLHATSTSDTGRLVPTGRGECAVPTSGTYQSCKRIFKDKCSVVDEFRTTLVEYETGRKKHAAYRIVTRDAAGKVVERVGHVPMKQPMDIVRPGDEELVRTKKEELNAKAVRRRGGAVNMDTPSGPSVHPVDSRKKTVERYQEIRGLRFSPERRIYLDRDQESAMAIGRLLTVELLGGQRPTPFHRSFRFS